MTDRELLELAAKAYGLYGVNPVGDDDLWSDGTKVFTNEDGELVAESTGMRTPAGTWNPLTDDGDALRLAVKLNMGISIPVFKKPRADVITFRDSLVNVIVEGDDPYAATRRAIVRAAAEIIKRHDAGVLRKAADICSERFSLSAAEEAIRNMAAELEVK